ncbi:hypothetical protein JTE90_014792, partial [Oedothorax gibbosus]
MGVLSQWRDEGYPSTPEVGVADIPPPPPLPPPPTPPLDMTSQDKT